MTQQIPEAGAATGSEGAQDGQQGTEDAQTTGTTSQAATSTENGAQGGAEGAEGASADDWEAKFKAQQKINRDLERKVKSDAALRTQNEQMQAEIAKLQGKEAEFEASRRDQKVKDDALSAANARILKADVRAEAAKRLADPADALRFLDLSKFEVDEDGSTDAEAISAAIEDLIEKKPYLAAQGGKRFEGKGDGGRRSNGDKPSQLTREWVTEQAAKGNHAAINDAREAGRLDKALGINT